MAHESESGLVPWAGTSPYPLEASFFEFCPTVFFDKVYESADSLIGDAMEALTGRLAEELPESSHGDVAVAGKKLENKFTAAFDANIDKFELYALTNAFHVPSEAFSRWASYRRSNSAQAPGAEGGSSAATAVELLSSSPPSKVTASQEAQLDSAIESRRQAVRAARRRGARLKHRLQTLANARAVLERDADAAEAALVGTSGAKGQPAFGSADALTSQATALAARAKKLRALMATATAQTEESIGGGSGGDNDHGDEKEGEEHDEEDDDEDEDEASRRNGGVVVGGGSQSAAVNALASVKRGLGATTGGGNDAAKALRKLTKRMAPDSGL